MAMEGVPWTKAWGGVFLFSFVMVEVLVILSWRYGDYEAVPGSHDSGKLRRIKAKLGKVDEILLVVAVSFYTPVGCDRHSRWLPPPLPCR